MPKIYVRCGAPDNRKVRKLSKILKIEPAHALGLCVGLWEKLMVDEHFDAKLTGWDADDIAFACRAGAVDPEGLLDAMLEAGFIEKLGDGTMIAHDWVAEQGELVKKLHRNRSRKKQDQEDMQGTPTKPKPGPAGDNTVVKVLLDRMRECHITGTPQQKREHAEAWHASGRAQKAEALIMGDGKGKGIFWLGKVLDGNGSTQASSSTEEILKKWAREGDAKDAAAAKEGKK